MFRSISKLPPTQNNKVANGLAFTPRAVFNPTLQDSARSGLVKTKYLPTLSWGHEKSVYEETKVGTQTPANLVAAYVPMKSTSLAEVLTPGQTVADCINHCRRSWQEILCIQLPQPTLGLVLSPHCMWHLEQTPPTVIIESKWSLFPSDWHRFFIVSFKRFGSKRCSFIAITRWQITVVFDDVLWSLRLWPYGSLLNGSTAT